MKQAVGAVLMLALLIFPVAARSQAMTDVSQYVVTDANDPLSIFNVSLGAANQNALRVCFGFKNLTSKGVSSAEFHFAIKDQFGADRMTATLVRNANSAFSSGRVVDPPDPSAGGFSDTNDGSQSCWTFAAQNGNLQGLGNGSKMEILVQALRFSDGTTWQHGATFARAFNHDGSAFEFVPEPFHTTWSTNADAAPVVVLGAAVRSITIPDVRMEQCITFRNVTNKTATGIEFAYIFSDASGTPLPDALNFRSTFSGTFSPPILIENKCWTAALPAVDNIRRMRRETIRVNIVSFSDGTQWRRGSDYFKAFSADGSPFSGSQPIVANLDNGNNTPVQSFGPVQPVQPPAPVSNSLGGVVGPSGQQFGEIAWIKGSQTAVGMATDKASAFQAQFAATSACQAKAADQDKDKCELILKGLGLNSAATRCATMVFDGRAFAIGLGRSLDDSDIDAVNKLRSFGGSIEAARTLVKGCNSQ
jgi:hypothetical protein